MSADEWIYAFILLISVLCGQILRQINGALAKQLLSSGVGAALVIATCGWTSAHSLITAVGNSLLVKFLPARYCHIASFIWCFSYLAFFRSADSFGFSKTGGVVNAVQLLATLRMIGLAFEVHDSKENKRKLKQEDEDNEDLKLAVEYRDVDPSFIDMIFYTYCHIGLFTGPYFRYRTYHDMLYTKNASKVNIWPAFFLKIKVLPISFAVFILISHYFDVKYAVTDDFMEHPLWYRILYLFIIWTWFRTRMYCAWIVAELVCVGSLLGAYPAASMPKCGQGPTNLKALKDSEEKDPMEIEYSFETIRNIDIYGSELSPGVRQGMKSWNMSVQHWLAAFIYRKCPIKSLRTTITLAVSAYWHGLHPGYYLSFLSMPLFVMCQDELTKTFRKNASPLQQKLVDNLLCFLFVSQVGYVSMAFLLLRYDWTITYWSSVYFCVHIMTVFFIVLSKIVQMFKRNSGQSEEESGKKSK